MSVTSMPIRRAITVVVAVGALLLGFAAIRAASAWTAEAAPLVASPESARSIESKLADEQARSADLQQRLATITGQTDDMAGALQAARDRIASDAQHADQLTKDLATANAKLKALGASIKQAAAAQTPAVTGVTTSSSSGSSSSGSHGGEVGDD
jgi:peptidoglycan hydrolase CwlO-like protein